MVVVCVLPTVWQVTVCVLATAVELVVWTWEVAVISTVCAETDTLVPLATMQSILGQIRVTRV